MIVAGFGGLAGGDFELKELDQPEPLPERDPAQRQKRAGEEPKRQPAAFAAVAALGQAVDAAAPAGVAQNAAVLVALASEQAERPRGPKNQGFEALEPHGTSLILVPED